MQVVDTNIPANRRQPVRLDGQDGPWSVSVAETPHDSRSYSLYIKTPTHNLTLTRTAIEILELDRKLRDSHPASKIPVLPIDAASLPIPPKRKSNFLNTLSRLASPTSNKNAKSAARRGENATTATAVVASTLPTPPLTSPASESNDPFTQVENPSEPSPSAASPSATSTAIAAYLTTISNAPELRKDRVWKRFVRVRTDDLESVRVERAIKRVRSDLAAHVGGLANNRASLIGSVHAEHDKENADRAEASLPTPEDDAGDSAAPSGGNQGGAGQDQKEGDDAPEAHAREATATPADAQAVNPAGASDAAPVQGDQATSSDDQKHLVDGEGRPATGTDESTAAAQGHTADVDQTQAAAPSSSSAATSSTSAAAAASRLHRSQSCEPDKSHKMARAYAQSTTPSQDGLDGGMSSQIETGDESSFSAAVTRKRKKKKKSSKKVTIEDFEMIRVLGKGCAGKVLLVRHKTGSGLFALKAITKRHVLAHQELQHTLTEQAVLKRMAAESKDPFVVKLWWSFHDKENLFLVMDFHPGGDLATQLARWGRLSRDRTRFYAAEIVEGVEGLHAAGVIYRDLKPENILIAADGHIVLTDFGLSKEFSRPHLSAASSAPMTPSGSRSSDFYSSAPGTPHSVMPPWMKPDKNGEMMYGWPGQPIGNPDVTTTFCGTAEYLAPEVIQGLPYSYEVDWWSFGTMLYEMLTGMTPFYANNHSDMYVRVLQDELTFPDERVMDQDTKSLIRGLLQKNPDLRIREPRIKKHPYFSMIDWCHVYYKRYIPPYVPPVDRTVAYDTQNFDETFLDMEPVLDEYVDETGQATDTDAEPQTDTDRTDGDTNTTPSQSRSSSVRPASRTANEEEDDSVDVFDGYSFKGRHSILMDDDDEDGDEVDSEEGEDDESMDQDGSSSMMTGETKSEGDTIDEDEVRQQQREEDGATSELEPKTPEARPSALPPVDDAVSPKPAQPQPPQQSPPPPTPPAKTREPSKVHEPVVPKDSLPSASEEELLANASVAVELEEQLEYQAKEEEAYKRATIIADPNGRPVNGRHTPPPKASGSRAQGRTKRREKSGVPALDKYLSDGGDDEPEMTEPERDEEDEDWDFVEAGDGEDRNGAKGTSLWARGVVDRYKLAVFRKGSTPGQQRSVSGMSKSSQVSEGGTGAESPSPSSRRGRGTGLNFRKHPRQFLRPKAPPSSYTNSTRSFSATASSSLSAAASKSMSTPTGSGLLTPVNTSMFSPSLKSKESAVSMDAKSMSSDYSGNVISPTTPSATNGGPELGSPPAEGEQVEKPLKNKKLKKYKNNAEKVFSLFSSNSPKPPPASAAS
ncbi:AGC/NDR protein kinase [Coprinopsis cinerea AmutBmut pab1-1]|nr:AGC/NDR protein kinase [Coprinopsis cinerea AmutBmut pab1-1]